MKNPKLRVLGYGESLNLSLLLSVTDAELEEFARQPDKTPDDTLAAAVDQALFESGILPDPARTRSKSGVGKRPRMYLGWLERAGTDRIEGLGEIVLEELESFVRGRREV